MRKELKTSAKNALKGSLGKAVAVTLLPAAFVMLIYLIQSLISYITGYQLVSDMFYVPFKFRDLLTMPVWSYVISGGGAAVLFFLLEPVILGTKRWYFKFFEKAPAAQHQTETVSEELLNIHFKDITEDGTLVQITEEENREEDTIVFEPITKQPQPAPAEDHSEDSPSLGEVFVLDEKPRYYFGALWLKAVLFIRSFLWILLFSLPSLVLFGLHFYLTDAFANGFSFDFIFGTKALYMLPAASLLLLSWIICAVFLLRYLAAPYIWANDRGCTEYPVSVSKAIKLSVKAMKGRKLKFIGNVISFFGWGVLSLLIFPLLYTIPYFNMFLAAFVHESVEIALVEQE